jgi:hypothetical protein
MKQNKASAFIFTLGFAVLAGCSKGPDKPEAKPPPGAPSVPVAVDRLAETTQVIAYYFHGTVRCETCLKIEKQAQELINRRFVGEVASQRLVFKAVNYDERENAHFLKDYKLSSPSLVLVRQKGGKDQDWKLLGQTWDLVPMPPLLDQYIAEETSKCLDEAK